MQTWVRQGTSFSLFLHTRSPSLYLSVCFSVCLRVSSSVSPSVSVCRYVCLSASFSACLCVSCSLALSFVTSFLSLSLSLFVPLPPSLCLSCYRILLTYFRKTLAEVLMFGPPGTGKTLLAKAWGPRGTLCGKLRTVEAARITNSMVHIPNVAMAIAIASDT